MANTMKAAVFEAIKCVVVKEVPIPVIDDDEVLVKVKNTGICGTDWSIYNGWYSADRLPMIPGHEFSGVIAQVGKKVSGLKEGDRITADINMSCGHCYYCIRGDQLLCNNFTQLGIHTDDTFAEYVKANCKECLFRTETFAHEPRWYFGWAERKGAARLPGDAVAFQLTRLCHVTTSCVGCGMCTSACPADLPVDQLFQTVARRTQAMFDYVPGRSLEEALPPSTFEREEFTDLGKVHR